ncbi:hypothetical protein [Microcystis sp. M42BS1]|uniref:hypothetical protein n=1 Tax=Microcystis sp. M42BS1 TaxID=2771192 RepID=UPI00258D841B|nr:hypothetical protein [Microcystis sp. M42BS1]MCA2570652.1 hypothetical protein [Microcystis sp. M42BS1]
MTVTLKDIKQYLLATADPDQVVELLDITVEQLLDRFEDLIEANYDTLAQQIEQEIYDEDDLQD